MSFLSSIKSAFLRMRGTSTTGGSAAVDAHDDSWDSFATLQPGSILRADKLRAALDHVQAGVKGTHVFEGTPDSRQSSDVTLSTSRFRARYRALTDDEKALHDAIKSKAAELEDLFEQVPAGRYLSLASTNLESSVSWAVKAF